MTGLWFIFGVSQQENDASIALLALAYQAKIVVGRF